MGDIQKNPGDVIDLTFGFQTFGESIGTLYPRAVVYDPDGNEISGSPFTLTHLGNNVYYKNAAFQADKMGTYRVRYIPYTDAAHTTQSSNHAEEVETITIKIQSTTGLGGSNNFYDDEQLQVLIRQVEKNLNKKFDKLLKDFRDGNKPVEENKIIEAIERIKDAVISMPKLDSNVATILSTIQQVIKGNQEKLIGAIKKNRSTIIKCKFDKALMQPVYKNSAETQANLMKGLEKFKIDMTRTIDVKGDEIKKDFAKILEDNLNKLVGIMDALDESIRKKLKFTLDGLKTLLFVGKQPKQTFKININKND